MIQLDPPPPDVIRDPVVIEQVISPVLSHVIGTPITSCEQTGRV